MGCASKKKNTKKMNREKLVLFVFFIHPSILARLSDWRGSRSNSCNNDPTLMNHEFTMTPKDTAVFFVVRGWIPKEQLFDFSIGRWRKLNVMRKLSIKLIHHYQNFCWLSFIHRDTWIPFRYDKSFKHALLNIKLSWITML